MSRALSTLENLLALSEAMASAAEAQEWDELVRISAERGTLQVSLPSDLDAHLPPAEKVQARTLMERCQHLDARIQLLVGDRQKALRILLREPNPVT